MHHDSRTIPILVFSALQGLQAILFSLKVQERNPALSQHSQFAETIAAT